MEEVFQEIEEASPPLDCCVETEPHIIDFDYPRTGLASVECIGSTHSIRSKNKKAGRELSGASCGIEHGNLLRREQLNVCIGADVSMASVRETQKIDIVNREFYAAGGLQLLNRNIRRRRVSGDFVQQF